MFSSSHYCRFGGSNLSRWRGDSRTPNPVSWWVRGFGRKFNLVIFSIVNRFRGRINLNYIGLRVTILYDAYYQWGRWCAPRGRRRRKSPRSWHFRFKWLIDVLHSGPGEREASSQWGPKPLGSYKIGIFRYKDEFLYRISFLRV